MDIQQVAKGAKVSTAAVSRVLNGSPSVREKTSQHVRRVIAELNYVPNTHARSLRVGRARMFGLIVSDINNPFFPELIDAFEALAAQQGIDVIFMHTNYDPKRLQTYTVYVTPRGGTKPRFPDERSHVEQFVVVCSGRYEQCLRLYGYCEQSIVPECEHNVEQHSIRQRVDDLHGDVHRNAIGQRYQHRCRSNGWSAECLHQPCGDRTVQSIGVHRRV